MDMDTFNHLCRWLDHNVREEDRDNVLDQLVAIYAQDPKYWDDKGWAEAYRRHVLR